MEDFIQDPFTVYKDYISVKLHFTSKTYDCLKYKGKSKASMKSYEQRKDKPFFMYLATKLNRTENLPFFVSQFIDMPCWIGNILLKKEEASKRYTAWVNRFSNILENYNFDLHNLAKVYASWKDLLQFKQGSYPELFKLVSQNKITPESYVLIDKLTNCIYITEQRLNDTMYSELNLKYKKYAAFIPISVETLLKITPIDLSTLNQNLA